MVGWPLSLSLWAGVLVDRSPLLPYACVLFIISLLLGKCFATALIVRLGHDAYCFFFIASIHDGLVGKPADACRYLTNSGCILSS